MAKRHLRAVGDDERGPKQKPKCGRCGGSGQVEATWLNPDTDVMETKVRTCPACGGKG